MFVDVMLNGATNLAVPSSFSETSHGGVEGFPVALFYMFSILYLLRGYIHAFDPRHDVMHVRSHVDAHARALD